MLPPGGVEIVEFSASLCRLPRQIQQIQHHQSPTAWKWQLGDSFTMEPPQGPRNAGRQKS